MLLFIDLLLALGFWKNTVKLFTYDVIPW